MQYYVVEKSFNGSTFTKAATITSTSPGGSTAGYLWLDEKAVKGSNYYRIKSVDADGKFSYSIIVKVNIGQASGGITVYPNPATGSEINLQLSNLAPGKYGIRVVSIIGQVVLSKEINHPGGSTSEKLSLSHKVVKGLYHLEILDKENSKTVLPVIIE